MHKRLTRTKALGKQRNPLRKMTDFYFILLFSIA